MTRFAIKTEYLDRYEIQTVGGERYQEYWIPAEDLNEFNNNIVNSIEVVAKFGAN